MKVKVGIIGVGTVGKGVIELIQQQNEFFVKNLGIDLVISTICARSQQSLDSINISGVKKTLKPLEVCADPTLNVILELAGGYEAPLEWVKTALLNKKHVITANKALLAKYGTQLFPLASKNDQLLMFEAAVGGGIPIIKTLQESLIANNIEGLACIINGTSNYILSEMTFKGLDFEGVLKKAQELGYAEADPTFDIEGIDAAHKVALLASLCFGKYVNFEEMNTEGIQVLDKFDVETAKSLGYYIKHLGVVIPGKDGSISASVHPALVKMDHQLASVNDVLNAVYIQSSAAGPLLLTGAGAGKLPTASSVMGDLITVCKHISSKNNAPYSLSFINEENKMDLSPIEETSNEFYLRFTTKDHPGVLAKITAILAEHNISIKSFIQKNTDKKDEVPVIIITHTSLNKNIFNALKAIDALDIITAKTKYIRFFG